MESNINLLDVTRIVRDTRMPAASAKRQKLFLPAFLGKIN